MTKKQDKTENVIDLRSKAEQRRREEQEELDAMPQEPDQKPTGGGPDDPRFVLQCLGNNERGDGILFAAMHRDQFLHNKATATWLKWGGHHWVPDRLNESMTAVEAIAIRYLEAAETIGDSIREHQKKKAAAAAKRDEALENGDQEAEEKANKSIRHHQGRADDLIEQRKTLNKRINRLRSVRGAANCLTWAHNVEQPLAIIGDELDRKPMLLPCENGVLDLRTGRLRPGDPADHLVKAVPVAFPEGPEIEHYLATGEGFQAPIFQKFITEIHQEDHTLIDFVHKLLGYCLTGLRTEHFIACFLGEGANGKGTLFELLHDILGDLAWSIEPEMILDQKNAKSSAGPSPDILSLYGRRLVVASETEEKRKISAAKVKRLTGGDTLTGRAPHDRFEINFKPTHKLILYTNHPPRGLASDFAMFRRLLYIWYPLRFVDDVEHHQQRDPQNADIYRQKDPDLPEKLNAEKPWILAWLVRGCLLWQAEGLKPPDQLRAAAEEIRRQEDHIQRFIDNACERVDQGQRVAFKFVYEQFKKWYEENVDESERYRPSKKAVTDDLRRKGYHVPPAKETGGTTFVYGLKVHDLLGV